MDNTPLSALKTQYTLLDTLPEAQPRVNVIVRAGGTGAASTAMAIPVFEKERKAVSNVVLLQVELENAPVRRPFQGFSRFK